MATPFGDTVYNPETVSEYFNEVLDTLLAVEGFAEVDTTLVNKPGLEITIWRYTDSGQADILEIGGENSGYSDAEGEAYKFVPKRCQDRVRLYDDDISLNPNVANYKMSIAPKHLVNTMRMKVVEAWYDTDNHFAVADADGIPTVPELILAQSELDLGIDNGINNGNGGERLCVFFSPADYRKFQAYLASENIIISAEIINGKKYTTVAGIPFQASEFIKDGQPIFATDKAVRLCYNQCKPTGSERNENKCLTTYYARTYFVAALEFIKKCLVFASSTAMVDIDYTVTGGTAEIADEGVPGTRQYIRNLVPTTAGQVATITVVDKSSPTPQPVVVDEHNSFILPETGCDITITFA